MSNRCPICEGERAPLAENKSFPFCSARCKMVDLGRWLGEEYFIPDESSPQIPDDDDQEDA